jgi:hypothetical protein
MNDKAITKNTKTTKFNPYKKQEFETFIKLINKGEVPETWQLLAEALGVDNQTITDWKKVPEFQEALAKGIQRSLEQMELVGHRDWRMWKDRYSTLAREKKTEVPDNLSRRIVAEEFFKD